MTTAVEPSVYDQCIPLDLDLVGTVELGPPQSHHVRDMKVADPPGCRLADTPPVAGDPLPVAERAVVSQCGYNNRPYRLLSSSRPGPPRAGHSELHRLARLVGQQVRQPAGGVDWLAVDGQHDRAYPEVGSRREQRRRLIWVPAAAGDNPGDGPSSRGVSLEVSPEMGLTPVGRVPVLASKLITVRRPQLPLELPNEIG